MKGLSFKLRRASNWLYRLFSVKTPAVKVQKPSFYPSLSLSLSPVEKIQALTRAIHLQHETQKISPKAKELDAYRMKALSLIQKYHSSPLKEAIAAIHKTPIFVEQLPSTPNEESKVIINFRQRLVSLHAREIHLCGSFERIEKGPVESVPILSSFRLLSLKTESPFPAPEQWTGWALPEEFFLKNPFKKGVLPLSFEQLLKKRRQIEETIASHKNIHHLFRSNLENNRSCFEQNKVRALELQNQLIKLLGVDPIPADNFFKALSGIKDSYDLMSLVHETVNSLFTSSKDEELISNKEILTKTLQSASSPLEKICLEYVIAMGECLGAISKNLKDQDHIISLLYRQQIEFLALLSEHHSSKENLLQRLEKDLELLLNRCVPV